MEYLENLKSRFANYYKKVREVPSRECKVENLDLARRANRTQCLTERRNISASTASAASKASAASAASTASKASAASAASKAPATATTSAPSTASAASTASTSQQRKLSPRTIERFSRLKGWKEEKSKKIEEQKAKMKPAFKVGAKSNIGFPKVNETNQKSFAPSNHVFKAPRNVKPIELKKPAETFKGASTSASMPSRSRSKNQKTREEKEMPSEVKIKKGGNKRESILKRTTSTKRKSEQKSVSDEEDNTTAETQPKKKSLRRSARKENELLKSASGTEDLKPRRRSLRLNPAINVKQMSSETTISKKETLKNQKPVSGAEDSTIKRRPIRKLVRKIASKTNKETVAKSATKEEESEESSEEEQGIPTPDSEINSSTQLSGAPYFRKALNDEISRLTSMCETWKTYKETSENLPEDAKDSIDVAVGQANLLMNKKFQQFQKLIVACENNCSEQPVNPGDLQGFWDMINIQVNDLYSKFNRLAELKNLDWEEETPVVQKKIAKQTDEAAASSSVPTAVTEVKEKRKPRLFTIYGGSPC